MDKVNSRALTETASIEAEVRFTITLVKKLDQGHRRPIESLKSEVESLMLGMIDAPCLG